MSDFLCSMLVKDNNERPNLLKIAEDPWINEGYETKLNDELLALGLDEDLEGRDEIS